MVDRAVEAVFVRVGPVWHLRAGGRVIRTTAEHPFYARGKGWTAAHALRPGDEVRLEGSEDTGVWDAVYNFRVADWHTYFVGYKAWGFSLWAHNEYDGILLQPSRRNEAYAEIAFRFRQRIDRASRQASDYAITVAVIRHHTDAGIETRGFKADGNFRTVRLL